MIRPLKTLWFLSCVGLVLTISIILIPAEGVEVLGFNIHMPSFKDLLTKDTSSYADISGLVKDIEDIDSLPDITTILASKYQEFGSMEIVNPLDTIKANADELAKSIYRIEFPAGKKTKLISFFEKLKTNAARGKTIRIMHYGDSQIEGDRITSYIRNKLQMKYGGSGPGLLPALQPYESYFSINQSNVGNWHRFTVFGKVNPEVDHNRYGPLAAFSRFAPLVPDSLFPDSTNYQASIIFEESKLAYASVRNFQKLRILYGNNKLPVHLEISVDEIQQHEVVLDSGAYFSVYEYTLPTPTKNLRLDFSGYDSPDIYGIALDGQSGIAVDNVALRGSSGTIFRKLDYTHLLKSYNAMDVDLFIMQFGGNIIPYVKDSSDAIKYGRWFYKQLETIKEMRPETPIIVIGPSDMSYKEGAKYITFPFLPLVRDELRKATFKAGFGYWDLYEAMGGDNSMPSWVRSEPALACTDYTHFTPLGAKLIANIFYNALMIEALK